MVFKLIKISFSRLLQHTKNHMGSLYWLTIAQIINFISLFTLSIFLGNFIDKTTYGEYKYILSAASVLFVFSISGFNMVIPRLVNNGQTSIVNQAFKSTVLSSLIGSFIAVILSTYYFISHNPILFVSFFIISISIPLFNAFQLYVPYLTGLKDYKRIALYGFFPDIFAAISTIIVSVYAPHTLMLICTYFFSNIFSHGLMYLITIQKFPPQILLKKNKEEEKIAINLSLINIVSALANNIDKFLIFHLLGSTSLAIISFAQAFPNQIKAIQKNIVPISVAKFSKDKGTGINLKKISSSVLFINLFVILLYVLTANTLFNLFFPNYSESINFSKIISLSLFFVPINYIIQTYLQINARIRILYKVNLLTYIIQILIGIILILQWKMFGAIIYITITPILQTVIGYIGYRQERKLNFLQNNIIT